MVASAPEYDMALLDSPLPDFPKLKIKLLDLLTNRYHLGVVRGHGDESMHVELPSCCHLRNGQRVRFVIAGEHALVSRMEMRSARITQVDAEANHIYIELTPLGDAVAA